MGLLTKAGHDVLTPATARTAGKSDPVHLACAIREGRVCISKNYRDFDELHSLVIEAKGHHPGILHNDLSPRGIVRAIRNVEKAGVAIVDQYLVLNHWR
jgi:hypothetical protein